MMQRVTKQSYVEMVKRLTSTAARFTVSRLTPVRISVSGSRLAQDLRPADPHNQYMVEQVLRDAAADLRKMGRTGDVQPMAVIDRAVAELEKLQYQPNNDEILNRCLEALSPGDYEALRLHLDGLTYQEIAVRLNTDADTILRSLTSTYANTRMQMIAGNAPDRVAS